MAYLFQINQKSNLFKPGFQVLCCSQMNLMTMHQVIIIIVVIKITSTDKPYDISICIVIYYPAHHALHTQKVNYVIKAFFFFLLIHFLVSCKLSEA